MTNKKISPERWQALYGPVPQDFDLLVQQALKKARRAPIMKRFTLRAALILLICLLLLTGIALAATGMFSTKNSLDMYTSAPTDGTGMDIQTTLQQTGGDFPDLTVKVRDAVFDGVTAFVTVEYKLKNPEKDMILSVIDTFGWPLKEYGRWPGYHERPLTDPKTDPRQKMVVEDQGTRVYGIQNHSIAEAIYESDGVLVLTYRIRLDSEGLYELNWEDMQPEDWENLNLAVPTPSPEPIWATMNPPLSDEEVALRAYVPNKDTLFADLPEPTQSPDYLKHVLSKLAGEEPLDLVLKADFLVWPDSSQDYRKKLYSCNVGITLQKQETPNVRFLQSSITQDKITLTDVKVTFTSLATYMDIQSTFPMGIGTRPENRGELGAGLSFEWVDETGNAIAHLGESLSGTYESGSIGSGNYERNRYVAFWPAVETIPDTITLRAYSHYTDEYLATFTVPLAPVQPLSPSPAP